MSARYVWDPADLATRDIPESAKAFLATRGLPGLCRGNNHRIWPFRFARSFCHRSGLGIRHLSRAGWHRLARQQRRQDRRPVHELLRAASRQIHRGFQFVVDVPRRCRRRGDSKPRSIYHCRSCGGRSGRIRRPRTVDLAPHLGGYLKSDLTRIRAHKHRFAMQIPRAGRPPRICTRSPTSSPAPSRAMARRRDGNSEGRWAGVGVRFRCHRG